MSEIKLTSIIPVTAAYQLWYPESFDINETKEGIVTITPPSATSNLTLSSFSADSPIDEKVLVDFFNDYTSSYSPLSELRTIINADRMWIERQFKNDKAYWLWWAISLSTRIVLASVNSNDLLSSEDRHLYTFMIDKMEIYPEEG